jgi:hypothetical protein
MLTHKQQAILKCVKCKTGNMAAVDKPAIGQILDVVDLIVNPNAANFQVYECSQCKCTYYKTEGVK